MSYEDRVTRKKVNTFDGRYLQNGCVFYEHGRNNVKWYNESIYSRLTDHSDQFANTELV